MKSQNHFIILLLLTATLISSILIIFLYLFKSSTKQNSYSDYQKFPTITVTDIPTKIQNLECGGIRGKICPDGYTCKYRGNYPDASGTCVKNIIRTPELTCPPSGWIDCMPGPNVRTDCSREKISWYEQNCPNFQGVAY